MSRTLKEDRMSGNLEFLRNRDTRPAGRVTGGYEPETPETQHDITVENWMGIVIGVVFFGVLTLCAIFAN